MYLTDYRNKLSEDPASGKVIYSGVMNMTNGSMNLAMEFDDYRMKGAVTRALSGSLTMGIAADGTGTMRMNVTMDEGQKTFSWSNFTSVVKQVSNHSEVTFTGRYYDFDYGYVDVTTTNPIFEDANYKVYAGQMRFIGHNGSWATLTFSESGYVISTSDDANTGGNTGATNTDPSNTEDTNMGDSKVSEQVGIAGDVFVSAKITSSGQTLNPPIDLNAHPSFVIDFQVKPTNGTNVELRQINCLGSINCGSSFGAAGGCSDRSSFTCSVINTSQGKALSCQDLRGTTKTQLLPVPTFKLQLTGRDFTSNPLQEKTETRKYEMAVALP